MFKRKKYYIAFLLWSLIYIVGTVLAPLSANRFNLTAPKTHLIQISLAIPIIIVWGIALYGAERFKAYALSIRKHPDGKALNIIGNGLLVLVLAVASGGIGGILRPWAMEDNWLGVFTIIYNYIEVILPLVAFYLMYSGSAELRNLAGKTRGKLAEWIPVLVVIAVIAALYTAALVHYQYRSHTPDPNTYSSFYMPTPLILLTLALPYLIGWALGIKAAVNIISYQKATKGSIYRLALSRFALGLIFVVGFAVILQLLTAFSTYFAHIGFAAILLIVYLVIILYALGFVVIALGSKKLNAIEKAV